jgi:hypothetical protein
LTSVDGTGNMRRHPHGYKGSCHLSVAFPHPDFDQFPGRPLKLVCHLG